MPSGRPTDYEEKANRLKNARSKTRQKKRWQGKPDCEQRQITDILTRTLFSKEKKNMWSNGLRYLRWGGDGEAVRLEKMKRRRKLLEICAESPASGARFVSWRFDLTEPQLFEEVLDDDSGIN
ncbi:MAG: hypothetical protein IPL71_09640 [Anaerolineales bacterium]|uniref:hypothetical protein n=1 Tax=Candidatus Villigracilis proximus TaxID=3140683 RepID=UPI0031355D1A|nr:hypothetical protein [Anaerolineales bacterium]